MQGGLFICEVTMKFDLFGFKQDKSVEYGLNLEDLLLIDYVWDMIASPTMQHTFENGTAYVWLSHDRILSDLPILNISNRSLINRLNKLKELGLLEIKTVHNEEMRGSKSYYSITEKCEALKYDQVKNIAVGPRPSENFCTSDINNNNSSNINNSNISNTSSNNINNKDIRSKKKEEDFLGALDDEKPKKKNKYEQCMDLIHDRTEDPKLIELLQTYLKMRLEMTDSPMYVNQWKGLLNELERLAHSSQEAYDIVQQSINRGYRGFFPVSEYKSSGFKEVISKPTAEAEKIQKNGRDISGAKF